MRKLDLSRLIRRDQSKPTLRERAAALRAAAAKVIRRPSREESAAEMAAPFKNSVAADLVLSAIERHRAARAVLEEASGAADSVAVHQAGGDVSAEAMAPAGAAWEAADAAERAAWEALLACRPVDAAGLAQMIRYIANSPGLMDAEAYDTAQNLAGAAENVAARASAQAPGARDPVFALIRNHRAAFSEWDRLDMIAGELLHFDPRHSAALAEAEEVHRRERAALQALISASPTTLAGVIALAEYLPGAIRRVDTDVHETEGEQALWTIADALRGIAGMELNEVERPARG